MNFNNKLWGEIDDPQSKYMPDVTVDIERSMNNLCLLEFDSDSEQIENQVEHISLNSMDPIMLYTISLHKFAAEMTETIQVAEITFDSNLTILQSDEGVPKIPDPPEIYYKHVPNNLNFIPKVKTDFTEGYKVVHPELSQAVAKKVLMQSTATMFAHIGYETTHNNVLLVMTEVLEDFFKKICSRMKVVLEQEAQRPTEDFPHYAERVLADVGLSYQGIHDYYQNRVLKYASIMYKRCEELVDCYQKLLQPKVEGDEDEMENQFGIQIEVEDEEVVEVQMHPNIEGKAGYASLEPGFQLLNSLEAVANFGDIAEDGNTLPNLSAAVVSDMLTKIASPPYNKKKRTK